MLPVVGRALVALGPDRMLHLLSSMELLRAYGDPIVFRRLHNRRVPRSNIGLFIQVPLTTSCAEILSCNLQLLRFEPEYNFIFQQAPPPQTYASAVKKNT